MRSIDWFFFFGSIMALHFFVGSLFTPGEIDSLVKRIEALEEKLEPYGK